MWSSSIRNRSNSSAVGYSASKIALYAILRVAQAPKCKVNSEGIYFFGCILCASSVTVKPKAELLQISRRKYKIIVDIAEILCYLIKDAIA